MLDELKLTADALIFDADGTLLDSMNVWNQADTVFLGRRGFEVTPDYTDYVKSVRIEEAARYTRERYNLDITDEAIIGEWSDFVDRAYEEEISLKNGAGGFVRSAAEKGFKIGLATALTKKNTEAAFRRLGIYDCFDFILTIDDVASGIDKSKPDIYLEVARNLGVSPDRTVVFEDVPVALGGARLGGFKTCAVWDAIGCGPEDNWKVMTEASDYCLRAWPV